MVERLSQYDANVTAMAFLAEESLSSWKMPLNRIPDNLSLTARNTIALAIGNRIRQLAIKLCESDSDALQAHPNIRIHSPGGKTSVPLHRDSEYGHSPEEINYWMCLTPAYESNSLQVILGGIKNFISAGTPALFRFQDIPHETIENTTPHTRISVDFRILPAGAKENVKRRGGYFRPKWVCQGGFTNAPKVPLPTIASLDVPCPVMWQREHMNRFYTQPRGCVEHVEFQGRNDTLETLMASGPVLAYSIRQMKGVPKLQHPIGFADEGVWFWPGQDNEMLRLWRECMG